MRPFHNPQGDEDQIAANQAYIDGQQALPDELRQPDWIYPAGGDIRELIAGMIRGAAGRGREARRREPEEMASNIEVMKLYPMLSLDKMVDGPVILRDIKLPPFKVAYDSHEQIHQKLAGTVILIKNNPFLVRQTVDLSKGRFALVVQGDDGGNHIVYYDDVVDCRGVAPGYFMYRGTAYWIYRVPERQNAQGMGARNMQSKEVGSKHANAASHNFLLQALGSAKDIEYAPNLHDVLLGGGTNSIRLSNRVALHLTQKKGAPVGVEYCGRSLGLIVNGAIKVMDENDLRPSWIHKDLSKVNLTMGA